MAIGDEENDRAMLEAVGLLLHWKTAEKNSENRQYHQVERKNQRSCTIRSGFLK